MSDWNGVEEFLAVMEAGGFSAAARRLGVSASHVSRQVSRLENRLGVKLLARTTRTVRPTDAGRAYQRSAADALSALQAANQEAAGEQAELAGVVRISLSGAFAEARVAPALAQFAMAHPQIRIELDFNSRQVDLVEEGIDFAVRYGAMKDSGLIARKLARREMICAARPSYLAVHGRPQHPRDLARHACLTTVGDRWVFKDPDTGEPLTQKVDGPWRSNNVHALRHAVNAGLGIAYCPRENLEPELTGGAVESVLAPFLDDARNSWIVMPERRYTPRRVRAVIDHLIAQCGD